MARQFINIGTTPNDKTGDPLRTAFSKINQNFNELYTVTGGSVAELTELAQDYAAAGNKKGLIALVPALERLFEIKNATQMMEIPFIDGQIE